MNVHVLFRMNLHIINSGTLVHELGLPRTVVLIYPLLPYISFTCSVVPDPHPQVTPMAPMESSHS
jgi:hypothetical protein